MIRSLSIAIFVCCSLTACGVIDYVGENVTSPADWFSGSTEEQTSTDKIVESDRGPGVETRPYRAADGSSPELPFTLRVIQEVNDGKRLYVHGAVRTKTAWPAERLVVRLTGFNAGRALEVAEYPLQQVGSLSPGAATTAATASDALPGLPSVVPAESEIAFVASVPSTQISNYQLEILWGKEAEAITNSTAPTDAALEVRGVRVLRQDRHCEGASCTMVMTIQAELFNSGSVPVASAALGVGYLPTGSGGVDFSQRIPENEDRVDVPNLNLLPGDARPVRLVLEDLPADGVTGYEPAVRVVAAEAAARE